MDVHIAPAFRDDRDAQNAAQAIRQCVHCGFCNATCPTYQLLGDELDGPRGRIYLVRELLEGATPTEQMRLHLDRCLTCLSCETTCPSGVRYGVVADFGRARLERETHRRWRTRLTRGLALRILPSRGLVRALVGAARPFRALLPTAARRAIPPQPDLPPAASVPTKPDPVRLHQGCVQPALRPTIDRAATQLLVRSGQAVQNAEGCCGALEFHMGRTELALRRMRANLERWGPALETSRSAFVSTASGCAAFLHRYGELLANEARYAARARLLTERLRDLSELIDPPRVVNASPVAFHAPCTLHHHLHRAETVADLLRRAGAELVPVANGHLCCGSAGTYSLFQPRIAEALRERKLADLTRNEPTAIVTANIGCLTHLQAASPVPVWHWAEWLVSHARAG